ncbi:hypothetical protein CesoFtcFv8_003577 [Champsocephalus esox]|uniref:Uncharacterized protein n=1 Tax=Champsocephalus esox TaxID=159716 RepID=A0AAN8HBM8_9TELE|nr:hypothetical protein CesoFtcFv8_003577 [Champsocephalus esox]
MRRLTHMGRLQYIFKQLQGALFVYRKYNCEVVMGSKVSSKMAAPAARVIQQAIRPHAPLIKFPNRQEFPRPNVGEVLKMLVVNTSPHKAPAPPPIPRPHVPLTPISGTADTLGLHSASPCEVPQETHDSGGNGLHPAWGTRVT